VGDEMNHVGGKKTWVDRSTYCDTRLERRLTGINLANCFTWRKLSGAEILSDIADGARREGGKRTMLCNVTK